MIGMPTPSARARRVNSRRVILPLRSCLVQRCQRTFRGIFGHRGIAPLSKDGVLGVLAEESPCGGPIAAVKRALYPRSDDPKTARRMEGRSPAECVARRPTTDHWLTTTRQLRSRHWPGRAGGRFQRADRAARGRPGARVGE